jgi:hypothetical protein
MKLKILLILYLSLCLCYSIERRLKRTGYSTKQGDCTTLIQYDKQKEKQLIEPNNVVFCNGIVKEDITQESNKDKSQNTYLLTLGSAVKTENVNKITYGNNVWEIQAGKDTKIKYLLKTSGSFYQFTYHIFFWKIKLLSDNPDLTEAEKSALFQNLQRIINNILQFKNLIDYISSSDSIEKWSKIVGIINGLVKGDKTIELKLLLEVIDIIDKNDIDILSIAINKDNDKLILPSKILIQEENRGLLSLLEENNKYILICLKKVKDFDDIFLQTLLKFDLSDIESAIFLFEKLKTKIQKFRTQQYSSNNFDDNTVTNFLGSMNNEFDIFSLEPFRSNEQKAVITEIFNFEGRKNNNMSESPFKASNLNTLEKYADFYKSLKYKQLECSKQSLFKNKQIDKENFGKLKELIKSLDEKSINDDLSTLKALGVDKLKKFVSLVAAMESISNSSNQSSKSFNYNIVLDSKNKNIITSLFDGISNLKLNPFLKKINSQLGSLDDFKTTINNQQNNNDVNLNTLNKLSEFINPFIININSDVEKYICLLNERIKPLGTVFDKQHFALFTKIETFAKRPYLIEDKDKTNILEIFDNIIDTAKKIMVLLTDEKLADYIDKINKRELYHTKKFELKELYDNINKLKNNKKNLLDKINIIINEASTKNENFKTNIGLKVDSLASCIRILYQLLESIKYLF